MKYSTLRLFLQVEITCRHPQTAARSTAHAHIARNVQMFTRGHDFKLKKRFSKTNSRKFTFSQQTVNDWNSLPPAVVSADDIKCFKTGVDNFLWNYIYDF